MLTADEIRLPGDLPLWEVPGWRQRFGVSAGITGRTTAAGAVFDLGLWTQRAVGDTMRDWRNFRRTFSANTTFVLAHQVHGTELLSHDNATPGWTQLEGADGHLTSLPNLALLVTVADCIPVYLIAPDSGAIAMLHAGWRGTAGGILAKCIARFAMHGIAPSQIVMHAGVGIAGASYQVGREVMDGVGAETSGDGPWYLDLRGILAEQGRALGIGEITVSGHDTGTERDDFYSHRASKGADGRMVAWIQRTED